MIINSFLFINKPYNFINLPNGYRDKNKEDLKLALSWAKQSVGYESECYNNFTLGKLYNALNDKDMALATFEKCIEIGKLRLKGNTSDSANIYIYIKEAERMIDDIKLK